MAEGEVTASEFNSQTIFVKYLNTNMIEIVATADRHFNNLNRQLADGELEIAKIDGDYKIIRRPNATNIELIGTIFPNAHTHSLPRAKSVWEHLREKLSHGELEVASFDGSDVIVRRSKQRFIQFVANIILTGLYYQEPHVSQTANDLRQRILDGDFEVSNLDGKYIVIKRHSEDIIHIMANYNSIRGNGT